MSKLERRLGVADAAALVVSNVIGVGIYDAGNHLRDASAAGGDPRRLGTRRAALLSGAMAYAEPREGPSSHSTRSALRPFIAAHVEVAMTYGLDVRPFALFRGG